MFAPRGGFTIIIHLIIVVGVIIWRALRGAVDRAILLARKSRTV